MGNDISWEILPLNRVGMMIGFTSSITILIFIRVDFGNASGVTGL